MTAQFAIPATTFVLQQILAERLDIAYPGSHPPVSIAPPPRPPATPANPGQGQPEPASLHVFLHHAAPNPAWRNMSEPHVNSAGRRVGRTPIALDLHYMLAATGANLEREILLGLGIIALTRYGIIPRQKIREIMTVSPPAPLGGMLPSDSPLADQPEQITVSQASVDVDLSTKIWSALQSPLRPSAYFLVTTVFLDAGDTYPPATPVKKALVGARPTSDPAAPAPTDTLSTPGLAP